MLCKKKSNELSLFDFKKIYDFFLSNSNPSDNNLISFLGGEPFLSWDLLKKCILHIRNCQSPSSPLNIWVSTNGTLLKPYALKFLKEFNVNISISLDGPVQAHNKYRRLKDSNKGSLEIIMRHIETIPFSERKQIGITTVITPDNCTNMIKIFSFIRSIGFKKFDFYPVFQYNWWRKKDLSNFKKAMEDFSDYYCKIFIEDKKDEVFAIMSLDTLIRTGQFWDYNKMERCKKLFVDQKGDFYPCEIVLGMSEQEKIRWCFGSIKTGLDLSLRKTMLKEAARYFKELFPGLKLEPPYFCPFSFYFWAKTKNYNCSKAISFCLSQSYIYRNYFLKIIEKIKKTSLFKIIYAIK